MFVYLMCIDIRRDVAGRERERFLSLNCMLYNHISSKNNSEWSYQGIY
ncbi:hypothetical protein XNW1_510006 [Xenorhabdus nematophila str. Websteri]|nr:hypothetical protein XNW1_4440006 [Xenorhabdus nematophila str. Websteri]CEF33788.1 hypothetical protein XNW1_510006 [Xenorhabdus nematophila str. Websteri]